MSDLLPLDKLKPFLKAELGIEGPIRAQKTATGQSNPTFVLETEHGKFVLRRKPPGELLKSAHAVEREYRVMKALEGQFPVPKMHLLCEDKSIIGAAFFVMEYIAGETFDDPAMPASDAQSRRAVYDAMNAGLALLHTLDPAKLGLSDFGRPGNYFARQLSRWSQQYEASATDRIADVDWLMIWLADHMPDEDGRATLVHGDWRIDNLLFDVNDNTLLAVLDWELSTLGHPMADLGAQLMQWAMPPGDLGRGLDGVDRTALGIPSNEAYIADYAARSGLADVPDMTFYEAFAFFRMAAILQGVKKRSLDGNASNAKKGLELGAYVPVLAKKARQRINAAR